MKPFDIAINHPSGIVDLHIVSIEGIFQILFDGKIIGALRPPGEDWQLLPLEDIISKLPVYEPDLADSITKELHLDIPTINLIIGEIENRIYHNEE
ncbi:hypothetical protein [Pedobacter mucosus]|uniref:hypothetical protein n=1 Tax=Pedobacter mucosus TaxID=2895286 RepID=UPI001EE47326|nr:hypothetical protein [Pedobacter mucosus]UKT62266.1 hypothetical protein LOK61_10880 [Pedobacter mucosus]